MHPVLFTIPIFGGLPVHTYGVMAAIGFLAGMWWAGYDARRRGENPGLMMDLVFYMILAGIVVSRIHYVLVTDPGMVVRAPLDLFKIWQGGITWYGGVLGGVPAIALYAWKKGLPIWTSYDIVAPGVSIGHVFGRLGCLMAGCCHGRSAPVGAWYGITFPEGVGSLAPTGMALYPTQVMESGMEFLIFLFLVWRGRHQKFAGQIITLYVMMYAVIRFLLEYLRGDTDRGWWIEPYVSTSQGIAMMAFAIGLIIYFWRRRYART